MEEIVMLILIRLTSKDAHRDPISGERDIQYGTVMRCITVTGMLLTFALPVALYSTQGGDDWGKIALIVIGIALGFATSLLVVQTFGFSIRIGDITIVGHSPWRMAKIIPWHEVRLVSYSHPDKSITITSSSGVKIKVSLFLSGLGSLLAEFRSRLEAGIYQEALLGFEVAGIDTGLRPMFFDLPARRNEDPG